MTSLKRKILITGSSRGIGAQIARDAHSLGYEVVLHGLKRSPHLEILQRELGCDSVCFDVQDWTAASEKLSQFDRLDVLINSAGVNISAPIEKLTLEDWRSIYATNVFGLVGVTNACVSLLQRSVSARIVNLGSVKGEYSATGRAAYASSKAAVSSVTVAMAKEFAPKILVNCIAPGFVQTEMTAQTMSPRIRAQIESSLLGRVSKTNEISAAVMFLCSVENSFITGQTLLVDGGFSVKKE